MLLCDEKTLDTVVQTLSTDPLGQLERIEALLIEFPDDPRLHFLYGSTLVGAGRLIEAHRSLSRAVQLAPDFAIARFQLGLFELTSGETTNALETLGGLDSLPDEHYLRKFADGLRSLIRDDFQSSIVFLRAGIALNTENPPLNNDMQMIVDRCLPLVNRQNSGVSDDAISETSLVLNQLSGRSKLN